jgi:pyrimidine operon attenuation protein/uracil phosphoribosyltransferase
MEPAGFAIHALLNSCIARYSPHTPSLMPDSAPILTKQDIAQRIERLASSIREKCRTQELALVGIHRRGVPFAERVYLLLKPHYDSLHIGRVDISLYRDDLKSLEHMPKLVGSDIPFDLDGMHVILFDEVLHTGRTSRAALDELLDHGRPRKVELAVLIDREGRQLPIQADYIGEQVSIKDGQRVAVHFEEVDGEDAVYVQERTSR